MSRESQFRRKNSSSGHVLEISGLFCSSGFEFDFF
jgi:hypothetical protein